MLLLGYFVFGELARSLDACRREHVIASGLYLLYRERLRRNGLIGPDGITGIARQ